MSMITLCPACRTPFHVTAAQLSARRGRVRCGKCNSIFDGVSHLLDAEPGEAATPRPSPQLALFDPARLAAEAKRKAEEAAARAEQERLALERLERERRAAAAKTERAAPGVRPAGGQGGTPALTDEATLPEFLAPPPARSRYTLLWGVLSVLASCALVAQAAVHYRTEFALLSPGLRAPLAYVCERIGCELRLPRRTELMSIDSSELLSDPSRPLVVQLNAVIRNRAPFPQEFPALELTLTDEADQPVVRRVLVPADYLRGLRPAPDPDRGLPASSELALRVDFEVRTVRASGYRLYLFYP